MSKTNFNLNNWKLLMTAFIDFSSYPSLLWYYQFPSWYIQNIVVFVMNVSVHHRLPPTKFEVFPLCSVLQNSAHDLLDQYFGIKLCRRLVIAFYSVNPRTSGSAFSKVRSFLSHMITWQRWCVRFLRKGFLRFLFLHFTGFES